MIHVVANHRFTSEEIDWGFTRFHDIESLNAKFIHNNQVVLSVYLRTIQDETGILWHSFNNYDSRKETGYTGIRNQGATCYMNSLLQSLYFTNSFRKAVYEIPTENEEPTKSVALALQRLFYNLQYSAHPVSTTELTRSFGWDSAESFTQHDVQEFNRVLQDNLEAKMKGTPADGAISALFKGKMKSFIKCINVDFESSRSEDYYGK
jgi:ubiquitin carboxyl-terminal hydrolase 7